MYAGCWAALIAAATVTAIVDGVAVVPADCSGDAVGVATGGAVSTGARCASGSAEPHPTNANPQTATLAAPERMSR
jgi:hypothetical protein